MIERNFERNYNLPGIINGIKSMHYSLYVSCPGLRPVILRRQYITKKCPLPMAFRLCAADAKEYLYSLFQGASSQYIVKYTSCPDYWQFLKDDTVLFQDYLIIHSSQFIFRIRLEIESMNERLFGNDHNDEEALQCNLVLFLLTNEIITTKGTIWEHLSKTVKDRVLHQISLANSIE